MSIGSIYDGKVSSLKWVSKNRKIARITADGKKIKADKKGTCTYIRQKEEKEKSPYKDKSRNTVKKDCNKTV